MNRSGTIAARGRRAVQPLAAREAGGFAATIDVVTRRA
jgi:hypothetical protein